MGLFDKFKKKEEPSSSTEKTADVSEKYLKLRKQLLDSKAEDVGINLSKDEQVFIVGFDLPNETLIAGNHTITLGMVFNNNTHIYFGNGSAWVDLEKDENVFKTMMGVCMSSGQVLNKMKMSDNYEYYDSKNVRAYLKTRKGVFFKELNPSIREDAFLLMMKDKLLEAINAIPGGQIHQID